MALTSRNRQPSAASTGLADHATFDRIAVCPLAHKQRAAFVMTARSPIKRILAYGKERGWENLRLYSDPSGDYTRDYVSAEDADMPGYDVFTRKDGTIRHFWSGEGGKETADPGQDSHDAPDMSGLWVILHTTPEGRGTDWYPKLSYDKR